MKADTMNEKTIELPPFSELARLTQWLDAKYARHKEIEDADASKLLHTLWRAAHRSRAAPKPASSPVAAEGQKARPLWLQDNPAGAAERDRLEWKFIVKTLAECRTRIEADGSRHSWLDAAENIARERATPTASMAEATCRHRIADARNPVVKDGYVCVDCGALFRAADHDSATPGPRGENAGGVVELTDEAVNAAWEQALADKDAASSLDAFAKLIQRACATAWRLRIAEKGDAS